MGQQIGQQFLYRPVFGTSGEEKNVSFAPADGLKALKISHFELGSANMIASFRARTWLDWIRARLAACIGDRSNG
jgi:hypothetical protein